jgi:hypothetical protein
MLSLYFKNWKIRLGKLPVDDHRKLFRTRLADLLNPQHELALLEESSLAFFQITVSAKI